MLYQFDSREEKDIEDAQTTFYEQTKFFKFSKPSGGTILNQTYFLECLSTSDWQLLKFRSYRTLQVGVLS